ncbi:MAG: hypothetical protein NTX35_18510 [Verrucomicrobia bacterium]|nr:hypothetical protein [Verrucomicrobiota bacterium]
MPDHPTSQYKWPSKVLRYKISCPFQRMLVVKHEAQIDWSRHRIESAEALDSFLREVMLPGLKDCITPDHPKSHYCKSIHLERMLANPAQHINQAKQIRQCDGDEAARQFLLGHINQHKKEHFEGWWRYLMEENPLYAQHPAFQYLVLRPVLESSTAKDTRAPLPVDAEALAHLFERMQTGRVAPGTKLLSLLSEIMAFGANLAGDGKRPSFGTDCRWVVVKKDDANAANRVAALSQGSGWCVASSRMAAFYLRSSDFHLLLEGGRAKVALRFSGYKAVEVQGQGNGDPGPWWPRILLYCAARGAQVSYRQDVARQQAKSIRRELGATQKTAKQLGDLLKAQPAKVHLLAISEEWDDASRLVVKEAWLACVRADPLCGGLLPDWMENDPAVKETTLEAWVALVRSDPLSYAARRGTLAQDPRILAALKIGWMALLKHDVTQWNQCPDFLKKDEEIIHARKIGWIKVLKRRSSMWNQCPDLLKKDEEVISALKNGWIKVLKRERYMWERCPSFLKKDLEIIQALKVGWIHFYKEGRRTWGWPEFPEILLHDVEMIESCKAIWIEHLKNDITQWKWRECPDFLMQDLEIINAHKIAWESDLESRFTDWNHCPGFLWQEFSQDAEFMQKFQEDVIIRIQDNVNLWNQCPGFLKKNNHVIQTLRIGWMERLKHNATDLQWNECPEFLKEDFRKNREFIQIVRTNWIELLQSEATLWNQCPDFIQQELKQDYSFISAFKNGWIERLKLDVDQWSLCPEILREQAEVKNAFVQGEIKWARSQSKDRQALWIQRLVERSLIQPEDLPTDMQPLLGRYQLISKQKTLTLPNDPLPAFVTACFNALLLEPQATLPIVKCWKYSPRIELARCAKALVALKEKPWNFIALSAEQQSHPLIQESAVDGWVDFVTKNPCFQPEVPDSLRGHQKIQTMLETLRKDEQAKHAAQILERVKTHSGLSDDEMSVLKLPTKEKQTWKRVTALRLKHWKKQLKADARVWEKVPQSLQQYEDLLKLMREGIGPQIRQNPALWKQLPACYQNDSCLQRVYRFATHS